MAQKKRVMIIGLDGFTWRLGRGFMAEGIMPNLKRLVDEGCHGNLQSVMPFETCPAWSAFQTGCCPGKTGVFSFFSHDRKRQKIAINNFTNIAVPTLWELADRAGKTVVSLNMPVTSPPPKVKGIIIPGLLCPKLSRETVHPPEAYDKYIKPHNNYRIVNMDYAKTLKEFVDHQLETEDIRSQVALQLIQDVDWDIFSIQMQSTDHLQHVLWWALDPHAHGYSPEASKEVLRFYRTCDDAIGKLVEAAGSDVATFVVSDHGFCAVESTIWLNVWLKQKGYLKLLPENTLGKLTAIKNKIKQAIPPLKFLAKQYGISVAKHRNKPLNCLVDLSRFEKHVDFTKTVALALGALGVVIYIKGSPEERQQLGRTLKEQMLRELGPGSPEPVIKKIGTGQETYGSHCNVDVVPDLVVELSEGVFAGRIPMGEQVVIKNRASSPFYQDKQAGTHSRQGIMAISGPGVAKGKTVDANLVDIIPTIMAYLGLPVPRHMDGQVLSNAFVDPLHVDFEDVDINKSELAEYSDAEQASLEKNLADLGYL